MKNVSIYKTVLPESTFFADLLANTSDYNEFTGKYQSSLHCPACSEKSLSSFGFNESEPFTLTPFGYTLNFKFEVKEIKSTLINQVLNKEIQKRQAEGETVTRNKKMEIKEGILTDLATKAIAQDHFVHAHYHAKEELLLIDTSGDYYLARILNFLRTQLGSLKTTTLHVDDISNGLTKNVKECLEADLGLGFAGFSFGQKIVLENTDKDKASFTGDYELSSVLDLIQQNYYIVKTSLHRDGLEFTLDDNLKISGIKLSETLKNQLEEQIVDEFGDGEQVDMLELKKSQALLEQHTQVELLVGISNSLVDFFSQLNAAEAA
ncbi:MAG: recombination-associated protein RdgC [Flavobacteriales bacterium]|nr:recombination-associated protein RdgC [Flavobacteriales bacterium]